MVDEERMRTREKEMNERDHTQTKSRILFTNVKKKIIKKHNNPLYLRLTYAYKVTGITHRDIYKYTNDTIQASNSFFFSYSLFSLTQSMNSYCE